MSRRKKLRRDDIFYLIYAILIVIAFIIAGMAIINNVMNQISEGKIVDKEYCPAHTTTRTITVDGESVLIPEYIPDRYYFTIEGEKNGKTVQYRFRVTSLEFDRYSIGDDYKK